MFDSKEEGVKRFLEEYRAIFEENLGVLCDDEHREIPPRLLEAMSYSLKAGGKRLRPVLCLAAAERCGVRPARALPMAVAYEMMHTASLIHDDLPCMDNDDLRRGKPTNHKVFGESMALLAGDALMMWAFDYALTMLRANEIESERVLRAITLFAEASGPKGICGGQTLDIDAASAVDSPDFVRHIAYSKTAVLIRGAITSGAILGDTTESTIQCYYDYGAHLGMAFQIVDDILDVTGTPEELGKTPMKDEAQGKRTFVSVYGLEESRRLAQQESDLAVKALEPLFPEGDALIDLAEYLVNRVS